MAISSFQPLIGGHVIWANRRLAGRAYRHASVGRNNHITLVLSGRARYAVNGRAYDLTPGRISCVSRGDTLEITALGRRPFAFLVLSFTLYDIHGTMVPLRDLGFPPVAALRRPKKIAARLRAMLRIFRGKDPSKETRLSARLIALVMALREELSGGAVRRAYPAGRQKERLERAVGYIYANLNRKLTLTEVARAACLNASYFNRLFKATLGESPMAFIARLKIERARSVLLNSELTVKQVAEAFGFQSQAHFSRKFKGVCGEPPAVFLRQRSRQT
jgi:AraC-like DNA-binding protein